MANPGKYFLEGFSRTYSPTFQNVLNNLQQRDRQKAIMDEQNRREAEKQKQLENQSNAFEDVLRGGENVQKPDWYKAGNNIPFTDQSPIQFHQYNQNELLDKLKQGYAGDPSGYFNAVQKMLTPKAPKTYTNINYSGKRVQAFDPNINKIVDLGENPNYTPKQEKVWIADERIGDKMNKLMGYENPEADVKDPQTRVINGKKYTITDHSTFDIWEKKNNDNKSSFDLSADTKKTLKDYNKRQQELVAITNAGFGDRIDPKTGKTYKDSLTEFNRVYLEAVRNVMPESANRWYNGLFNATSGNTSPEDYILNLKEAYIDGKLGKDPNKKDDYDLADFNVLLEQFKALYGFDAQDQYGMNLDRIEEKNNQPSLMRAH